jgi:uncharacterized protein YcaQ
MKKGKDGILDFIHHVGCIQFDPINIVGRNPDLVLQSRIKDYQASLLDELLYQDRQLLDGWDKMASIYTVDDWPYFLPRREYMRTTVDPRKPADKTLSYVLNEIKQHGPLSSLDFKDEKKVDWYWGPTKAVRAGLEYLYARSYLGIHHRVSNRRYFDLIERLLPSELLSELPPFKSKQEYHDWHILRRIGSMGLAQQRSGDYWYGIVDLDSQERNKVMNRLIERGELITIQIVDLPNPIFFIRKNDLPNLNSVLDSHPSTQGTAFIAALDNLTWNRVLIYQLFNFEYSWEVYKPKTQRRYGYYVLPVIHGDCFIARFEPLFDKKDKILTLKNWWWESAVEPNEQMFSSLTDSLKIFMKYLGAQDLQLGENLKNVENLNWMKEKIG